MSKLMTYDEWRSSKLFKDNSEEDFYSKAAWNVAREGMIPENEAIRIPPENEWPKDADFISVRFYNKIRDRLPVICEIPRPTSKWTPKVGDKVFVLINIHQSVGVGEISEILTSGVRLKNDSLQWSIGSIKPFDVNKIGMRWKDI